MKKLFALVLALVVALSMVSALAAEEGVMDLALGTSGFSVAVSDSYAASEITAEDTDESQVGYYSSPDSLVDFDVYQWVKAEGETLESIAAEEAAEYGAEAAVDEINGITVYYYYAKEEYDGTEYDTVSFLMENGDVVAEIVFWLDGETALEDMSGIINTLILTHEVAIDEGGTEIVLGTSGLKITTSVPYVQGIISAEDTDESQVAYYSSADSLVDFDVYQWAKAEGETLESVTLAEAAEYGAEIFEDVLENGIVIEGYYTTEEFEGETYETCTIITEDGDNFVELVFWLDGEDAALEMTAIVGSMTHI